eukprot:11171779-Lingulodinium_polyedra.AAC.1
MGGHQEKQTCVTRTRCEHQEQRLRMLTSERRPTWRGLCNRQLAPPLSRSDVRHSGRRQCLRAGA